MLRVIADIIKTENVDLALSLKKTNFICSVASYTKGKIKEW